MAAKNVARMERIGADGCAATAAGGTEMVQSLEVAAFAFPVADRVVHKLEIAHAAKIGDWEDGLEHSLQPDVLPLVGQKVHLQKPLVRVFLNFNQVRNRDRGLDLGKINALGGGPVIVSIHSFTPDGRIAKAKKLRLTVQCQRRAGKRRL